MGCTIPGKVRNDPGVTLDEDLRLDADLKMYEIYPYKRSSSKIALCSRCKNSFQAGGCVHSAWQRRTLKATVTATLSERHCLPRVRERWPAMFVCLVFLAALISQAEASSWLAGAVCSAGGGATLTRNKARCYSELK